MHDYIVENYVLLFVLVFEEAKEQEKKDSFNLKETMRIEKQKKGKNEEHQNEILNCYSGICFEVNRNKIKETHKNSVAKCKKE